MKTINKGFDECNEEVLKGLRNETPGMEEISVAIDSIHFWLRQAFGERLDSIG